MSRRSTLQPASVALPDPAAVLQAFNAAAPHFDAACAAHDRARDILLARLDWLTPAGQPAAQNEPQQAPDRRQKLIVDAGCGTGRALPALREKFPDAVIAGIDISAAMLRVAAGRADTALLACADVCALPFASASVDLLLANLVLPWVDPRTFLEECQRVLRAGGLLLLATTGPATLQQLRRAWRSVDTDVHVHAHFDMQTLGDLLVRVGLHDPVLDVEQVTLHYSTPARLHAELHALGAGNSARGRRGSLTGKDRFRRYEQALAEMGTAPGRVAVTLELIFLQAFGGAAAAAPEPQFHGIPLRRA